MDFNDSIKSNEKYIINMKKPFKMINEKYLNEIHKRVLDQKYNKNFTLVEIENMLKISKKEVISHLKEAEDIIRKDLKNGHFGEVFNLLVENKGWIEFDQLIDDDSVYLVGYLKDCLLYYDDLLNIFFVERPQKLLEQIRVFLLSLNNFDMYTIKLIEFSKYLAMIDYQIDVEAKFEKAILRHGFCVYKEYLLDMREFSDILLCHLIISSVNNERKIDKDNFSILQREIYKEYGVSYKPHYKSTLRRLDNIELVSRSESGYYSYNGESFFGNKSTVNHERLDQVVKQHRFSHQQAKHKENESEEYEDIWKANQIKRPNHHIAQKRSSDVVEVNDNLNKKINETAYDMYTNKEDFLIDSNQKVSEDHDEQKISGNESKSDVSGSLYENKDEILSSNKKSSIKEMDKSNIKKNAMLETSNIKYKIRQSDQRKGTSEVIKPIIEYIEQKLKVRKSISIYEVYHEFENQLFPEDISLSMFSVFVEYFLGEKYDVETDVNLKIAMIKNK